MMTAAPSSAASAPLIARELSWVDFNFRVLAEAENPAVPLLERMKFIAIVSSNLDEFITVRVAALMRQAKEGDPMAAITLSAVSEKIREMRRRQYDCLLGEILSPLAAQGVHLVKFDEISGADLEVLRAIYESRIAPTLTPLAIDPGHPFPLLTSGALYMFFNVASLPEFEHKLFRRTSTILMQVPGGLERFYPLPAAADEIRLISLEDIIRLFASSVLSGYAVNGIYVFRVLRDAQTVVDEDAAQDLLGAVDEAVRSRRWGEVIATEASIHIPDETMAFLQNSLNLPDPQFIFRVPRPLGLKGFFEFVANAARPDLLEPPWAPQAHPRLSQPDIFAAIRAGDALLSLPYQKFDPVTALVEKAAADPRVLAIKITLYRVAGDSPLIKALISAARQGKQVTALVELRARFDEHNNITWARALDAAGAHVIYGVVGYKTHSKVMLVVRNDEDGLRRYVHLSTGNYNNRTARTYTDVGLFSAASALGRDISSFFNVITGYSLPPRWNHITMAPTDLRAKILQLIKREVDKHTPQNPGFIRAKMNSLVDPAVIAALYHASQSGLKIHLLVRGMCCLRAGVAGWSENITVRSILDRYLEHSRIFHFHNGGNEEVYLASADWMERNFDERLELMFPVLDAACQQDALMILNVGLADNVKAWEMQPEGSYARVAPPDDPTKAVRSQEVLFQDAARRAKVAPLENTGVFKVKTRKKHE